MTTTSIKDFRHKTSYDKLVKNKLFSYMWNMFYKPMFKMFNIKRAENSYDIILNALQTGKIFYTGQGFVAKDRFSNKVVQELLDYGASYDKYNKMYIIGKEALPSTVSNYIEKELVRSQIALNQLNSFILDLETNLDHYIQTMIFDDVIKNIMIDVQDEIGNNVKNLGIIEPELTQEQLDNIAKNYTYNMQYYVKKFEEKRLPEMRVKVQEAVLNGFRADQVVDLLKKEYHIGEDKAKFLARNETAIVLSEYKKETYKGMGFDKFIWKTILDGREREEHKELNNKVFSFDDPPIIDQHTGQKGLPGQTYNCRCSMIPVRSNGVFA